VSEPGGISGLMRRRPLVAGLLVAVIVFLLDQASKWWVLLDIMNPPRTIEVLPFFNLVLVWNRGVSFGMFPAGSLVGQWMLIGLAAAICVALLFWLRGATNRLTVGAIGLIIGGAVGNVLDRLVHGAVVDFLDVHAAGYHWPAFNVADSAICVGAGLLILDSLTTKPHNGGDSGSTSEPG